LEPRGALAAIRSGADLAVVAQTPPPSLTSRLLATLPLWAYVRADDPWAGLSRVSVSDLSLRQLVLLTPDLRPRALLDGAFDAADLSYDSAIEVTNAQVAQAVAAAGRGVAVVSDDSRFGLVPLHIDGLAGPVQIRLYAAWDPRHHAASALAALADRLATFCADRYGEQV
jgi:DNA-binding transcriptional LysR family regulator